jgi:hypothetical protein
VLVVRTAGQRGQQQPWARTSHHPDLQKRKRRIETFIRSPIPMQTVRTEEPP